MVSNLSSFFTLCIDLTSNAKNIPAHFQFGSGQSGIERCLFFSDSLNLEYRLILLHGIYVHITASFTSLCNTPIWSEEIKGLTRCKKHLPAPMKEPFATIWFP
jgi:hypothetical protein